MFATVGVAAKSRLRTVAVIQLVIVKPLPPDTPDISIRLQRRSIPFTLRLSDPPSIHGIERHMILWPQWYTLISQTNRSQPIFFRSDLESGSGCNEGPDAAQQISDPRRGRNQCSVAEAALLREDWHEVELLEEDNRRIELLGPYSLRRIPGCHTVTRRNGRSAA